MYSLRPEILVIEMDVSRCILVLDTSIFIYFDDKYFQTEGVVFKQEHSLVPMHDINHRYGIDQPILILIFVPQSTGPGSSWHTLQTCKRNT